VLKKYPGWSNIGCCSIQARFFKTVLTSGFKKAHHVLIQFSKSCLNIYDIGNINNNIIITCKWTLNMTDIIMISVFNNLIYQISQNPSQEEQKNI
jgi:hypothetical protein